MVSSLLFAHVFFFSSKSITTRLFVVSWSCLPPALSRTLELDLPGAGGRDAAVRRRGEADVRFRRAAGRARLPTRAEDGRLDVRSPHRAQHGCGRASAVRVRLAPEALRLRRRPRSSVAVQPVLERLGVRPARRLDRAARLRAAQSRQARGPETTTKVRVLYTSVTLRLNSQDTNGQGDKRIDARNPILCYFYLQTDSSSAM